MKLVNPHLFFCILMLNLVVDLTCKVVTWVKTIHEIQLNSPQVFWFLTVNVMSLHCRFIVLKVIFSLLTIFFRYDNHVGRPNFFINTIQLTSTWLEICFFFPFLIWKTFQKNNPAEKVECLGERKEKKIVIT